MAASDSHIDENAINDVEGDLLESVAIRVSNGRKIPRRGDSKSKEGDMKESSKL